VTTRNEFIATTAARYGAADATVPDAVNITHAEQLAYMLEARNVAPWLTPPAAPALHDLERAVVDTGLSWERDPGSLDLTQAHIAAVRALRAARGGATPGAAP
jgi:hypothetical protein